MSSKEGVRGKTIIIAVMAFIGYYLLTDPDLGLLGNIPFGVDLVLTLNIIVFSYLLVCMVEILPDSLTDSVLGEESENARLVISNENYSSLIIAKAIRILAYSIIIAAVVVSMSNG